MHNILIVDDEPMLLTILTDSLKKYSNKFSITTAKDGLGAIMALKDKPFDLVITDINMPIINGLVLLAYMHKNFPKIPCIAMTGFGTPFLRKRMKQDSAHYIEKPFKIEELLRAIRTVLRTGVISGTLNGISVEGFLKMIELEMITCLCEISATNPKEGELSEGYLYFEQGDLYQAYYGRLKGKKAALKIFQMNDVMVKFKRPTRYGQIAKAIKEDTETLMLEAMRRRDEFDIPMRTRKRSKKVKKTGGVKKRRLSKTGKAAHKPQTQDGSDAEKARSKKKTADSKENGELILTDISMKIMDM